MARGTAAGHGGRPRPPAGRQGRPLCGPAVPSLVLGAVSGARGNLACSPAARCAGRAVGPAVRSGAAGGPSGRHRPWSVPAERRVGPGGRGRRSGPGSRRRHGPVRAARDGAIRSGAVRDRAPGDRSARGGPRPAGLLAAVDGPGHEAGAAGAGKLPARVHGPRGPQQRSAPAYQAPGGPRQCNCSLAVRGPCRPWQDGRTGREAGFSRREFPGGTRAERAADSRVEVLPGQPALGVGDPARRSART